MTATLRALYSAVETTAPPRPPGAASSRPCLYPDVAPRTSYRKGCRCAGCTAANAAYQARRRRTGAAGYVNAAGTRRYLLELRQSGLSLSEIARRAAVPWSTLHDILDGTSARCRPAHRAAILGLLADSGQPESVISECYIPGPDDPLAGLRLLFDVSQLGWKTEAECARIGITPAESERLFFPRRGEDGDAAKAICARCIVREACLDFALRTGAPGIWGGTTGKDRRAMRAGA